ncbi:MAG TPA: hypothetical protein VMT27_09715 [Actinomycetes bacterium]|nr:hypothetical protein [Actinomycetes bacterium]
MIPRLMLRRSAVMLSAFALVGSAAAVVAPGASAAAAPTITFTSLPVVGASSATIRYSVNRQSKAVAKRECSLSDGTTTTYPNCGDRTSAAKTNPATYSVTLNNLAVGFYAFTVTVTLTDGGRTSATTLPFTVSTSPPTCFPGGGHGLQIGGLSIETMPTVSQYGRATSYSSGDDTCSGPVVTNWVVIAYGTDDGAQGACSQLGGTSFLSAAGVKFVWPTAPDAIGLCGNE